MMFYDERIELERGRIARNGLAIAAVFALLGALLRGMNIYLNMGENRIHPKGQYYLSIATECIIAAVCLAALIVGVLYGLSKTRDERATADLARYWKTAGRVCLLLSLAGYAFFLPFSLFLYTNINFVDVTSSSTVYQLFLLLSAYTVYAFKQREIYFNYSIIESPRYSFAVLKNVCKLGLGSLVALMLSLFGTVIGDLLLSTSRTVSVFLVCLAAHLLLFGALALLYALFSLLERVSFQKQRLLSGAPLFSLLAVILLRGAYGMLQGYLAASGLPLVQSLQILSGFSMIPMAATLAFIIFLLYYDHEYRGRGNDPMTRAGTLCLLLSEVVGGDVLHLFTLMRNLLIDTMQGDIRSYLIFSDLLAYAKGIIHFVYLAGFALLILGPVRKGLARKGHLAAVAVSFAALGVEIFLYMQSEADAWLLASTAFTLLRMLYLVCFLRAISKRAEK